MQCRQARARMSPYTDKELDVRSVMELESHLRQCTSCRETLDELQRADKTLQSMPRLELGPEFSRRVVMLAGQLGPAQAQLLEDASPTTGFSQLLEGFRELFGLEKSTMPGALDEFNDFFPLSISSTYFSIFGQSDRS